MKFSLRWLRELVDTDRSSDEIAHALTHGGFEVEGRTVLGGFSGVVVAEVRAKRPHPQAQKLTLVDVWDGAEVTQVVCGATNVPEPGPGARVLWAKPGAKLPDGKGGWFELAVKEVRGIASPGMLCAEDELGLSDAHAGIVVLGGQDVAEPGQDAALLLGLPDEIWELNVTPNRADCLGHIGVAREVAALCNGRLTLPEVSPSPVVADDHIIEIRDPACRSYVAAFVDGVTVCPSPLARRLRLAALGVRPISNVVDVTSWVLLETGQPLHAFDRAHVDGGLIVRRAEEGESLVTLDGQTRVLDGDDLINADRTRPLGLAGVMGGQSSQVSLTTSNVIVEAAWFESRRVRRTARRLGMRTEASLRFERGVDPGATRHAAERAADLLVAWAGGTRRAVHEHGGPFLPTTVTLRPSRTVQLLGVSLSAQEQAELLGRLGFKAEVTSELLSVQIPTYRADLTREVDLIEEVARVYGYDRIPTTLPPLLDAPRLDSEPVVARAEAARTLLCALGLDEQISYGFIGPRELDPFDDRTEVRVTLANPFGEEQSVMRTTLLPGLVASLARNHGRGTKDVRAFEVGEVFLGRGPDTLPDERIHVALVLSGGQDGWLKPGAPLDVFDARGVVEELFAGWGLGVDFAAPQHADKRLRYLHPGVQSEILFVDGKSPSRVVGALGELHPEISRRAGLVGRALVAEIDLTTLGHSRPTTIGELPRFPHVLRDLSFFVDIHVSSRSIAEAIDRLRDPLCVAHRVVEDYREPGRVPDGKKGMLWSFTYRHAERTLTDDEVKKAHEALCNALVTELALSPR